jgi:hypothetical protein
MRKLMLGAALVVLVGCGKKLNMEQTFDLPIEGKQFVLEPVSSEQKIKVTAKADAAVSVYIYLEKHKEAAEQQILTRKFANILQRQEKTDNASLEATIPANEAAVVRVGRASKGTKVTLRITNQ